MNDEIRRQVEEALGGYDARGSWSNILGALRAEFPRHKFGFAEPRPIIHPSWWRKLLGEKPRLGFPYGVVAVIGPHYSIETCARIYEIINERRPMGIEVKAEFYGE